MLGSQGSTLPGNDLGGTEIDELDDTVVVKQDVYSGSVIAVNGEIKQHSLSGLISR